MQWASSGAWPGLVWKGGLDLLTPTSQERKRKTLRQNTDRPGSLPRRIGRQQNQKSLLTSVMIKKPKQKTTTIFVRRDNRTPPPPRCEVTVPNCRNSTIDSLTFFLFNCLSVVMKSHVALGSKPSCLHVSIQYIYTVYTLYILYIYSIWTLCHGTECKCTKKAHCPNC